MKTVSYNGKTVKFNENAALDNAKGNLRELSAKIGFQFDSEWNSRTFGAKLIGFVNGKPISSSEEGFAIIEDFVVYKEASGTINVYKTEGSETAASNATPAQEKPKAPKQEDKDLEKIVEGSASEVAKAKVRVYAKSQKWGALGIIDAYLKMYPHATLDDLNKAFPISVIVDTPDGKGLLDTYENSLKRAAATSTDFDDKQLADWKSREFFLTLQDGTMIVFTVSMWTKEMFEKIVRQAKVYDIIIAQYEAAEKGFGKRGEYSLEYLNGYVPPVPTGGKSKTWLWILIAAILVILALVFFLMRSCNKQPEVKVVTETVVVHDTLYLQQIEEIEKNFNAANFEAGKADLSDDTKYVLHDLAKVMQKNPELRLKLEGHTSAEGDAAFNQKLSEARAQAAVDFLVGHEGIDASRLQAEGFGSSKLKNTDDPMSPENRRTEFIVLE